MKLTKKQKEAIDWLNEIQLKEKLDITLRWVDDYWRVCPATINNNETVTIHVGKINMRTWQSLINKGLFKKVETNLNDDGFMYIYEY